MVEMSNESSEKISNNAQITEALSEKNFADSSGEIKCIVTRSPSAGSNATIEMSKNWETSGSPQTDRKIFSAPPGVKRYNVKWANTRRNSGGQRLIFVWPQKARNRTNCLIYFEPLLRRVLIGLMYLGSVHLWPGEFLPTIIPPTVPLRKPPVRCSVIEPLWEDENKIAAKEP